MMDNKSQPKFKPGGVEGSFRDALNKISSPKVLELGTLQWTPGVSTHHGDWLPHDSTHIKSDIEGGPDVDIVADAHKLSAFKDEEFDAFIAISVWEHLRHPWVAAAQAARVLKPGGLLYVATHHTFPVHGYPSDYGRWTDNGLEGLFDKPLWKNQMTSMSFPCTINPDAKIDNWNHLAPAYLNVDIFAVKN
jgi:SAM-dependent methyltransferase